MITKQAKCCQIDLYRWIICVATVLDIVYRFSDRGHIYSLVVRQVFEEEQIPHSHSGRDIRPRRLVVEKLQTRNILRRSDPNGKRCVHLFRGGRTARLSVSWRKQPVEWGVSRWAIEADGRCRRVLWRHLRCRLRSQQQRRVADVDRGVFVRASAFRCTAAGLHVGLISGETSQYDGLMTVTGGGGAAQCLSGSLRQMRDFGAWRRPFAYCKCWRFCKYESVGQVHI